MDKRFKINVWVLLLVGLVGFLAGLGGYTWHNGLKAQWRLDYISAENSMGFHAPQETARLLAEAIDYARQGQVSADTIKN